MRRIIDGARILVLAGLIVGATHGPARAQNQTCSEFAQFALGALQDSQVGSSAYMAGLLATQPAAPQFVEKIADKTFRKRAAYLLGVSGLKTSATECRFDGKVSARAVASLRRAWQRSEAATSLATSSSEERGGNSTKV